MPRERWLKTAEVAELLGISCAAVRSRIVLGRLPAKVTKDGHYVVLCRDALIAAKRKSLGKYGEKQS